MNNIHQELIEEKVAGLKQNHCYSHTDPLKNKHFFLKSASAHNTKLLFADIEKTLQDTIDTVLKGAVADAYENAIELSDKIELSADLPDGGVEQWKAFKRFRNTLRDTYLTPLPDKDSKSL